MEAASARMFHGRRAHVSSGAVYRRKCVVGAAGAFPHRGAVLGSSIKVASRGQGAISRQGVCALVYAMFLELDAYLDCCFKHFYDVSDYDAIVMKENSMKRLCQARDDLWNYLSSTAPSKIEMQRTCTLWKIFVKRFISAADVAGVTPAEFQAVAVSIIKTDASLPEKLLRNNAWDTSIQSWRCFRKKK